MQISNVEDVKINVVWVKSWVTHEDGVKIQRHTRSSIVYRALEARCEAGGHVQEKYTSYEGCVNKFSDYQSFTNWCQTQYGYMHKQSNGKFWSLDKDLFAINNKIYSPETCVFVPQYINCLFTNQRTKKLDLPLGVIYKVKTEVMSKERSRPYEAKCSDGTGKQISLGFYSDPLDAHFAYLEGKIKIVKAILEKEELKPHEKLQEFVGKRMLSFEYNLNNRVEIKDI